MITIAKDNEKRIDWNAIRAEYIGGGTSYRKLCEKYGISFEVLKIRAKNEKWPDLRTQAEHKATTRATQKVAEAAADNATLAARIKTKGLMILDRLMDEYTVSGTEHRDYKDHNVTDIKRLRDITAAYKDLTDDMPKAEAPNELLQALMDLERGAGS